MAMSSLLVNSDIRKYRFERFKPIETVHCPIASDNVFIPEIPGITRREIYLNRDFQIGIESFYPNLAAGTFFFYR